MANKLDKAAARRTGTPTGTAEGTEEGQQKQLIGQVSEPEERNLGAGGANPDFLQETLF